MAFSGKSVRISCSYAGLTKVSLPWGRMMVFSRLFITILHSSFSTLFSTVFSHTEANSIRLLTNTHISGQASGTIIIVSVQMRRILLTLHPGSPSAAEACYQSLPPPDFGCWRWRDLWSGKADWPSDACSHQYGSGNYRGRSEFSMKKKHAGPK